MQLKFLFFLSLASVIGCAQNESSKYDGEWVGFLPDRNSFSFEVAIEALEGNTYHLIISNDKTLIDEKLKSSSKTGAAFNIKNQLFFNLNYNHERTALTGFIKSGRLLYHVNIPLQEGKKYVGKWYPFMVNNGLQSDDVMLYMETMENGQLVAYPFLGDQRFRGTWTEDFNKKGHTLFFKDGNTGFNFRAKLLESTVELEFLLVEALVTKTILTHTSDGWEYSSEPIGESQTAKTPLDLKDGWKVGNITDFEINKNELLRLIDSINSKALVNTHSILVAKEGNLVFEEYFDGFNANIPHDLRSASKSISSAMIGIAIDEDIISGVDEKLYDVFPKNTTDDLKSKIKIKDLLTMSGGMDVNNLASENYYQDPSNSKSWLQTVLDAPMLHEPGTYGDYGSANPFLLGVYLNERLPIPLENYMDKKLFAPLGITNYINQTDDTKVIPYFGGGMLLTPRDLLKFGQLFLNKGQWNGKRIISEDWVTESFGKYVRLQDQNDKNEYGYLWWHDSYNVNGRAINSIEARGAGGQFIFILPELESVIVITSGNFRNRKGNQPRDILQEFILPSMVN